METERERLNVAWIALLLGLIVGLFLGLVVLGWWVWPVKWVDAIPGFLSFDEKVKYMQMSMEAFGYDQNPQLALDRYNALGEESRPVLVFISQNPSGLPNELIGSYTQAVTGLSVEQLIAEPVEASPAQSSLMPFLIIGASLVVLFLVAIVIWLAIKSRKEQPVVAAQSERIIPPSKGESYTSLPVETETTPEMMPEWLSVTDESPATEPAHPQEMPQVVPETDQFVESTPDTLPVTQADDFPAEVLSPAPDEVTKSLPASAEAESENARFDFLEENSEPPSDELPAMMETFPPQGNEWILDLEEMDQAQVDLEGDEPADSTPDQRSDQGFITAEPVQFGADEVDEIPLSPDDTRPIPKP